MAKPVNNEENDVLWSERGLGYGESGSTLPTKNLRITFPPHTPAPPAKAEAVIQLPFFRDRSLILLREGEVGQFPKKILTQQNLLCKPYV